MSRRIRLVDMIEKPHGLSNLTEDVAQIIYDGIKAGLPNRMSHELAGVKERCFYNWMSKGEKDIDENIETAYSIFVQTIKQVRAKSAMRKLKYINSKDNKSWQAKAWLLERCHASSFAVNAQEMLEMKDQMNEIKALLSKVLAPQEIKNEDE